MARTTQVDYSVGASYSETMDGGPMKVATSNINITFYRNTGGDYDGTAVAGVGFDLDIDEARLLRNDLDDAINDVDRAQAALNKRSK